MLLLERKREKIAGEYFDEGEWEEMAREMLYLVMRREKKDIPPPLDWNDWEEEKTADQQMDLQGR